MANQGKRDSYDRQLPNTILNENKGGYSGHFDTRKKTRIMRKKLDKINSMFRMARKLRCMKYI